ncbi:phosphoglycerate mutase [Exiguobacterium sp. S17]|nr:phosphoglycerate mutase [Exiguobacterium sp. S17]
MRERILSLEPRADWFDLLRHSFDEPSFKLPEAESGLEATARILDVVAQTNSSTILVTHGNLLALLLQHVDNQFDFETWRKLSNPDVYQLEFVDNFFSVTRVWTDSTCG